MGVSRLIRIANELHRLERGIPFRFLARMLRAEELPSFDEWVGKQKFKNPMTRKEISWSTLEKVDPGQAKKVREQFEAMLKKYQKTDENDPVQIKRMWGESKKKWQARVKQNDAEIAQWRKEEIDRVFGPKVKEALLNALEDEEDKKAVEELEEEPLEDMEPANVQILKRSLDKSLDKFDSEKVTEYDELFGDDPPWKHCADKMKKAKENEKKVQELMDKAAGLEGEEADNLAREAKELMDEMEELDAAVEKRRKFIIENQDLVHLKNHHSGLIKAAWKKHEEALKAKNETPPERPTDPEELSKGTDRIIDKMLAEKADKKPAEEKPKAEPDKKEKAEEDEHKPGDIWGKKPKLYAKNPKGEVGGPFKGMNEAKRWSKGKAHTPEQKAKAEKTRKEQQKAKKRKKRGDEIVFELALERVGRTLLSG